MQSPIYILGGGSLGLLYASAMRRSKSKVPIRLLLQQHHKNKVLRNESTNETFVSVKFEDVKGKQYIQDIPCDLLPMDNSIGNNIRNILLTTKATQAVAALESVSPCLDTSFNVIIMCNGNLAVAKEIKDYLSARNMEDAKIIYGSSTHGALRSFDGDEDSVFAVKHTGQGQTFLANDTNNQSSDSIQSILESIWSEVGLSPILVPSDRMFLMNWKKLAANCSINPLTTLRHCHNGDLISNNNKRPKYEDTFGSESDLDYNDPLIFYRLIREVSDLSLIKSREVEELCKDAQKELNYINLTCFVEEVARNTARNKSSMLQDALAHRYPTEINYLNGYVARLGLELGGTVDVQANKYITEEVEKLTKP